MRELVEYLNDEQFTSEPLQTTRSEATQPVNDDELLRFFADTCGPFPDSKFLNYNLPRTKRVLTGRDYARIIAEVPNLVCHNTFPVFTS